MAEAAASMLEGSGGTNIIIKGFEGEVCALASLFGYTKSNNDLARVELAGLKTRP